MSLVKLTSVIDEDFLRFFRPAPQGDYSSSPKKLCLRDILA